ncbi:MAG: hypothetical protein U0237_09265 [Thermoleophilia bacterium]
MPDARAALARILGHPVPVALPSDGAGWVAGSLGAESPPRARVAWADPDAGTIRARVACPAGVPSRWRPVVAAEVTLEDGGSAVDRVLVARTHAGITALAPVMALEDPEPAVPVGDGGLTLLRIPRGVALIGIDALGPADEAVGRLDRVGIADLHTSGGAVSGRLGAGHGMGAGIGDGHWAAGVEEAEFEAGYRLMLPAWVPEGFAQGDPRIEPEASYPAAPPAVILAWEGEEHRRVLLRQAPAPLASPDPGGPGTTPADVNGHPAVLRGRGRFMTLVWETPERAFGVQIREMDDAAEVALRVARSIPGAS